MTDPNEDASDPDTTGTGNSGAEAREGDAAEIGRAHV